jgi:hypothetical protein
LASFTSRPLKNYILAKLAKNSRVKLSTKSQAPAFAGAASRRQAKLQISSPAYRQAGMNKIQNSKQILSVIWNLKSYYAL